MINVDIKIDDGLTPLLKGMQKELAKYPAAAEQQFVKLTPIDTGNARRKTSLNTRQVIEANYPYAQRLDQGWSKQAPQGMTKPFEAWQAQQAKKIFGI
jgi:hypothetical protein